MLALFKNSTPAVLVIGPVKVFTPVRVRLPAPFLVNPPFALPASSGWVTVTLLLVTSMMAPPARMLACIRPENHGVGGLNAGCRVPPLKLNTAFVPVLEATLKVTSVPPFRLLVPNEPAMRAMFMPPSALMVPPL